MIITAFRDETTGEVTVDEKFGEAVSKTMELLVKTMQDFEVPVLVGYAAMQAMIRIIEPELKEMGIVTERCNVIVNPDLPASELH